MTSEYDIILYPIESYFLETNSGNWVYAPKNKKQAPLDKKDQ
jgi:hypothetical protein